MQGQPQLEYFKREQSPTWPYHLFSPLILHFPLSGFLSQGPRRLLFPLSHGNKRSLSTRGLDLSCCTSEYRFWINTLTCMVDKEPLFSFSVENVTHIYIYVCVSFLHYTRGTVLQNIFPHLVVWKVKSNMLLQSLPHVFKSRSDCEVIEYDSHHLFILTPLFSDLSSALDQNIHPYSEPG